MAGDGYSLPTLLCSRPVVVPVGPRKSRRPAALDIPEDDPEAAFHRIHVKNTFIDSVALLSPSLENFYSERVVRTCPSQRVGCLADRLQDALVAGGEFEPSSPCEKQKPCEIETPCGMLTPCLIQTPVAERFGQYSWRNLDAAQQGDIFRCEFDHQYCNPQHADVHGVPHLEFMNSAPRSTAACDGTVTDLRLADLLDVDSHPSGGALLATGGNYVSVPANSPRVSLSPSKSTWYSSSQPAWSSAPMVPPPPVVPPPPPGPALGSPELPSIGSAAHGKSSCRPCAFLHTKGCENGLACTFCHLCEPGERKRRQKEKLQQRRAAQQARLTSKAERCA